MKYQTKLYKPNVHRFGIDICSKYCRMLNACYDRYFLSSQNQTSCIFNTDISSGPDNLLPILLGMTGVLPAFCYD